LLAPYFLFFRKNYFKRIGLPAGGLIQSRLATNIAIEAQKKTLGTPHLLGEIPSAFWKFGPVADFFKDLGTEPSAISRILNKSTAHVK